MTYIIKSRNITMIFLIYRGCLIWRLATWSGCQSGCLAWSGTTCMLILWRSRTKRIPCDFTPTGDSMHSYVYEVGSLWLYSAGDSMHSNYVYEAVTIYTTTLSSLLESKFVLLTTIDCLRWLFSWVSTLPHNLHDGCYLLSTLSDARACSLLGREFQTLISS